MDELVFAPVFEEAPAPVDADSNPADNPDINKESEDILTKHVHTVLKVGFNAYIWADHSSEWNIDWITSVFIPV
jgi:hypothetical protein